MAARGRQVIADCGWFAAVPGTTFLSSSARQSASGSPPASGTTTRVSGSPERLKLCLSGPKREREFCRLQSRYMPAAPLFRLMLLTERAHLSRAPTARGPTPRYNCHVSDSACPRSELEWGRL